MANDIEAAPRPGTLKGSKSKKRSHPFLKRVIIPFWTLQLALQGTICAFGLLATGGGLVTADTILGLLITLTNIILILSECILICTRRLKPVTFLVLQVVKTTLWLIIFFMTVAARISASNSSRNYVNRPVQAGSGVGYGTYMSTSVIINLSLQTGVLLLFIGLLIYASVIYHRHRRAKAKTHHRHRHHHSSSSSSTSSSTTTHLNTSKPQLDSTNISAPTPTSKSHHPAHRPHPDYPYLSDDTTTNTPPYAFSPPPGTAVPPYEYLEMQGDMGGVEMDSNAAGQVGGRYTPIAQLGGEDGVHELAAVRSVKSNYGGATRKEVGIGGGNSVKSLPKLPRKAFSRDEAKAKEKGAVDEKIGRERGTGAGEGGEGSKHARQGRSAAHSRESSGGEGSGGAIACVEDAHQSANSLLQMKKGRSGGGSTAAHSRSGSGGSGVVLGVSDNLI